MYPGALNSSHRGHSLADLCQLSGAVALVRVVVDLGQPPQVVNLQLHGPGHPVDPGNSVVTKKAGRVDPDVDVAVISIIKGAVLVLANELGPIFKECLGDITVN